MIKSLLTFTVMSLATAALAQQQPYPFCSANIRDSCMQTPAQNARAMTGAQAAARDAAAGGIWVPNLGHSDRDYPTISGLNPGAKPAKNKKSR